MLPLWVRVDLVVMAMKGHSTLPRSSELEPHHQMQFCIISRTPLFGAVLQWAYSKPYQQGGSLVQDHKEHLVKNNLIPMQIGLWDTTVDTLESIKQLLFLFRWWCEYQTKYIFLCIKKRWLSLDLFINVIFIFWKCQKDKELHIFLWISLFLFVYFNFLFFDPMISPGCNLDYSIISFTSYN